MRYVRSADVVRMWVADDGVGIFDKIARALALPDPRQSLLEISKGKLDVEGVSEIGQAFADEIFRVFAKQNPRVDLRVTSAGQQVSQMISRAKSALAHPP